jgi:hypothetical protein
MLNLTWGSTCCTTAMAVRVCSVGSLHSMLLLPLASAMKMISWSCSLQAYHACTQKLGGALHEEREQHLRGVEATQLGMPVIAEPPSTHTHTRTRARTHKQTLLRLACLHSMARSTAAVPETWSACSSCHVCAQCLAGRADREAKVCVY